MAALLLALRNLGRGKKRTALLGGAIAASMFVVTLLDGVAGGLRANAEASFARLYAGHLFIQGVEKDEDGRRVPVIPDEPALEGAIRASGIGVRYLAESSGFRGVLLSRSDGASEQVVGTDEAGWRILRERLVLSQGSFDGMRDPEGIVVSDAAARSLAAGVGDEVLALLHTASGGMKAGEFTIRGISEDPGFVSSLAAYANLRYVNALLGLPPGECQTLGIYLADPDGMDAQAAKLRAALERRVSLLGGGSSLAAMTSAARTERWTGARYGLYTLDELLPALAKVGATIEAGSDALLLALLLVVMVGVANAFRMIARERAKEIGTLRALGMQRSGVRDLFMLEALFLALGGVALGLAASAIAMALGGLIDFGTGGPLYLILRGGHAAFAVSAPRLAAYAGLTALLTVLAALLPALRSAKLSPADALRADR